MNDQAISRSERASVHDDGSCAGCAINENWRISTAPIVKRSRGLSMPPCARPHLALPPSSRFRSAHWRLMAAVPAGRLSNGQAISLAKQSDHEASAPARTATLPVDWFGEILRAERPGGFPPPRGGE